MNRHLMLAGSASPDPVLRILAIGLRLRMLSSPWPVRDDRTPGTRGAAPQTAAA